MQLTNIARKMRVGHVNACVGYVVLAMLIALIIGVSILQPCQKLILPLGIERQIGMESPCNRRCG